MTDTEPVCCFHPEGCDVVDVLRMSLVEVLSAQSCAFSALSLLLGETISSRFTYISASLMACIGSFKIVYFKNVWFYCFI